MASKDTRQAVMAAARAMVQARGYNALSFRDLAEAVGVKSSSIHYYFPTKGDLGAELARQYTGDFLAYLDGLPADVDWKGRLAAYIDMFRATLLRENRMCMGGIMAAEYSDLAPEVKAELAQFTSRITAWLAGMLALGMPELDEAARNGRAGAIFAAVEGAQLVARGCGDVTLFDRTLAAYRAAGLLP